MNGFLFYDSTMHFCGGPLFFGLLPCVQGLLSIKAAFYYDPSYPVLPFPVSSQPAFSLFRLQGIVHFFVAWQTAFRLCEAFLVLVAHQSSYGWSKLARSGHFSL
jgi:hypothetical protein